MNCICEFLYQILPTSSSKVQAWASLLTAGVAGYALNTWKKQGKHQAEVELMKYLTKSFNIICDIRNPFSGQLTESATKSIESTESQFHHLRRKGVLLTTKLDLYSQSIEITEEKYLLSISMLGTHNAIRKYYTFIKETIDDIKEKSSYFNFIVDSMDDAQKEFHKSGRELETLGEIDDNKFKKSDFGHRFITIEDAIAETRKRHNRNKERWDTILKGLKETENIIFRSVFGRTNDEIHEKLTEYYNDAIEYCKNYSNPTL